MEVKMLQFFMKVSKYSGNLGSSGRLLLGYCSVSTEQWIWLYWALFLGKIPAGYSKLLDGGSEIQRQLDPVLLSKGSQASLEDTAS